jgi:hypothetical protein
MKYIESPFVISSGRFLINTPNHFSQIGDVIPRTKHFSFPGHTVCFVMMELLPWSRIISRVVPHVCIRRFSFHHHCSR